MTRQQRQTCPGSCHGHAGFDSWEAGHKRRMAGADGEWQGKPPGDIRCFLSGVGPPLSLSNISNTRDSRQQSWPMANSSSSQGKLGSAADISRAMNVYQWVHWGRWISYLLSKAPDVGIPPWVAIDIDLHLGVSSSCTQPYWTALVTECVFSLFYL